MSRYSTRLARVCAFVCVAIVLTVVPAALCAQTLSVFDIDTTAFPTLKAKFYAFDAGGNQVARTQAELTLKENGLTRTITNVTCPQVAGPRAISSVLTMDVSGSMEFGPLGVRNIDLAKAAGRAWVAALAMPQSECAVTSFDNGNYFNRDFTTDAAKLNASIGSIAPQGGTDYNLGLLSAPAGSLQATKAAKHQKIVVFLTDGLPSVPTNQAAIIAEANAQGCIVYVVTLGMPCPVELRNIATQTGGNWFQNVTTVAQAEAIYRQILAEAQSGSPCSITWQSVRCPGGKRDVALSDAAATGTNEYTFDDAKSSKLQFAPASVFMRAKPPGAPFDTTVTVTAVNDAFAVTNVTSTNAAFDINPKTFSLSAGQSMQLTVRFTPVDSSYQWTEFDFVNASCAQQYYASGGFPGKRATAPTLVLKTPNGGEQLLAGSQFDVTWSGIPETDNVKLEYSTDAGTTWRSMAPIATGGLYDWKVANTPTTTALARVTRLPAGATDDTGLLFTLTGHTDDVMMVRWSPDGARVATAGFDGSLTIFDALTGTTLHTCATGTTGLYCLDWNTTGTQVAVSGEMGHASIWNALTGARVRNLSAHAPFAQVWTIGWKLDGTQLATASQDGTCMLWNAASGANTQLNGHASSPQNLVWNPTGTQFASVGMDRVGIVWTSAGTEIAPKLTGHAGGVYFVDWSPTGTRIATASEDGTAKVWDATSHALVATMNGHSGFINSVQFSPDGTRILTSSDDRTARVWNAATGAQMFALNMNAGVNDAAWSKDGSMIVTGGDDNLAIVWDAASGTRLQDLVGHSGAVLSVEFSSNGLYVATGGEDNTAKIWGIYETPLMRDTSDAVFAILRPTPVAIDINMGRVVVGGSKDSVITAFVSNTGTYPFEVDSVVVRGADATQFGIVSGFGPYTIAPGSSHAIEMRFIPASVGVKSASLRIFTSAGSQIQSLSGEGVAPELEVVGAIIDFGQVPVNTTKTLPQTATVRNIGAAPITITGVRLAGPNGVDFASTTIGQSFTLNVGGTAQLVDVAFTPSEMGRTSGRLLFDHDGPGSPATVFLFGEGIASLPSEKGTALLQVGSGNARAGDIVNIAITLTADSNLANTGATSITGQLRFNKTLLVPLSPLTAGTLDGNDRVLDLTLPTQGANGELMKMSFRAALGTDSITPLVLENLQAHGGSVAVTSQPGTFKLDGICLAGGVRLVNPNGLVALSSQGPNPVLHGTTTVELETTELGHTTLTLRDLSGRIVKNYIDGIVPVGRRTMQLDVSEIASGAYILSLSTPTVQRAIRIEVAP